MMEIDLDAISEELRKKDDFNPRFVERNLLRFGNCFISATHLSAAIEFVENKGIKIVIKRNPTGGFILERANILL